MSEKDQIKVQQCRNMRGYFKSYKTGETFTKPGLTLLNKYIFDSFYILSWVCSSIIKISRLEIIITFI